MMCEVKSAFEVRQRNNELRCAYLVMVRTVGSRQGEGGHRKFVGCDQCIQLVLRA